LCVFIAALVVSAAAKSDTAAAANEPAYDATGDGIPDARASGSPSPEPDNTAEVVFREVGMFGTWATDCGRPASPDNPHVDVSAPGAGLVLENNDVGPGYAANRYSILSARRLPKDQLEVSVIFRPGAPGEERQTLIVEVRDGTRRTMFNRVEGGDIRVQRGIVLSRGIKTPVLKKCGQGESRRPATLPPQTPHSPG
jgi:hypothetical protein